VVSAMEREHCGGLSGLLHRECLVTNIRSVRSLWTRNSAALYTVDPVMLRSFPAATSLLLEYSTHGILVPIL